MRINSNISSLMAQRQLSITTKAIARSLGRLSTGQRVGGAFDGDTASLSMINKLEAQRRGYLQANQNINQAQGMLSTAESAMDTQIEILVRMRELTLQASNGSLTNADRENLNLEVSQLFQEFQRLTQSTDFNGIKLLDGSLGQKTLQTQSNPQNGLDTIRFEISDLNASKIFLKTVGTGSFASPKTQTTDVGNIAMVTADLNGDGKMDLAVANSGVDTISIRLGNGDGTYQQAADLTTGVTPTRVDVGDFNGDGIKDLVSFNESDYTMSIFIGKGDGTYKNQITFATYCAPAVGDLNGDGRDDLVTNTLSVSNSAAVFYGQADGSIADAHLLSPQSYDGLTDVRLVDLNHDHKLDLVSYDWANDMTWMYLNNGSGDFSTTPSYIFSGTTTTTIGAFGDFNNDGNMDFVSGIGENQIYFGNGTGASFTAGSSLSSSHMTYFKAKDLNNDGSLDLVADTGEIYLNNGSGAFTMSSTISLGITSFPAFDVADMNGDGVMDIVGSINETGSIGTYLANTATATAVSDVNITTQAKAQALLSILDTALTSMRGEQARLGALHERLDIHASNNLLLSDNLAEAKSRIQDVDLALEISELVRNQILQQAQVAVLAQANVQMRMVIDLLRFS